MGLRATKMKGIFDAGLIGSGDTTEGPIQMLTIDALLMVFNLLSLYDKLIAMRVCKKWHQIISSHHAWTVIDFTEVGPQRKVDNSQKLYKRFVSKTGPYIFEYQETGNAWTFPKNNAEVLKFLRLYASHSLQQLILPALRPEDPQSGADDIIEYIARNCPNIKVLVMFLSHKQCPNTNLQLFSNFQYLQKLHFTTFFDISSELAEISCISKFPHLQSLRINFGLSMIAMTTLSKMTQLRDLELTSPGKILTENFETTLGKLPYLRRFKLVLRTTYSSSYIDQVLIAIGNWTHLEDLTLHLVNCTCTIESFEMMLSGLINLQSLEFGGEMKQLRDLQLTSPLKILTENFETTLGKLPYLRRSKLVLRIRNHTQNETLIDQVLIAIGNWTHLEDLTLRLVNCTYAIESFEMMLSGLANLQSLEFDGYSWPYIFTEIELIGTYLQNLKALTLAHFPRDIDSEEGTSQGSMMAFSKLLHLETLKLHGGCSAESLQSLSNHPALEHLEVGQTYQYRDDKKWVEKVWSVLATFPKLRKVKITVLEEHLRYFQNINLVIDSADIEVAIKAYVYGGDPWYEGATTKTRKKEKGWKRKKPLDSCHR